MYLKKCTNSKTGRTYLSIAKKYRDPISKKNKESNIKSLGYLDELEKKYDNPISHFTEIAKQMTKEYNEEYSTVSIKINPNERLKLNTDNEKNLGYIALCKLFHELEIDKFLLNKQRFKNFEYNTNSIMQLLVYARLLYPSSKLDAYDKKNKFFERFNFSLDDTYRSLSFLDEIKEDLQLWLHEHIRKQYRRDTSLVYYDLTNYYFEIDKQDDFRRKGICKEHRPDPIVQMGLFMDRNGLPVSYKLFSGNEADCSTLRPMVSEVARNYSLGKIIVVADKGIISSDNIWYTLSAKDGYVFSYSVRKASEAFKKYVLNQNGYNSYKDKDSDSDKFKIKSRLTPRIIEITAADGKKIKKEIHEKQVIVYSEKYAKRAKHDRAETIAKAKELIKNPGKFNKATTYGAAKYIKNIECDSKTGEILENSKKLLSFDEEKLKEEEKYDGYYAIVTSEYKMADKEILDVYHGLWKIEETFKVTKTGFKTRPIYLSKKDHIEGHFLTCFIALTLLRILELKLNNKYSSFKILKSLRKYTCNLTEENQYLFTYYDEIIQAIGKEIDIDLGLKYSSLGKIKKNLGKVKKS